MLKTWCYSVLNVSLLYKLSSCHRCDKERAVCSDDSNEEGEQSYRTWNSSLRYEEQ